MRGLVALAALCVILAVARHRLAESGLHPDPYIIGALETMNLPPVGDGHCFPIGRVRNIMSIGGSAYYFCRGTFITTETSQTGLSGQKEWR